jgi:hypothetical protein
MMENIDLQEALTVEKFYDAFKDARAIGQKSHFDLLHWARQLPYIAKNVAERLDVNIDEHAVMTQYFAELLLKPGLVLNTWHKQELPDKKARVLRLSVNIGNIEHLFFIIRATIKSKALYQNMTIAQNHILYWDLFIDEFVLSCSSYGYKFMLSPLYPFVQEKLKELKDLYPQSDILFRKLIEGPIVFTDNENEKKSKETDQTNKRNLSSDKPTFVFSKVAVLNDKSEELFNSIRHKFTEPDYEKLKLLIEGYKINGKVFFNGTAAQLANIFSQMFESKFMNAKDVTAIDNWLSEYFLFSKTGTSAEYKSGGRGYKYLRREGICKNPVISIVGNKISTVG